MLNGIAIALAWPETLCKQPGSWYDVPLKWIGINENNYYKVGHAAIVLIDNKSGYCHYFDFGRYHTPYQYGRVRSALTDHDLEMKSKAKVSKSGTLENYGEILLELFGNESCHGIGKLHSSYCRINFERAYKKAVEMQTNSPIPYGPFLLKGTNCSRFVNTILLSGKPSLLYRLVLAYPKTLSPTPIGNVSALNNYTMLSVRPVINNVFKSNYSIINNLSHVPSKGLS